MSEFTRTNKIRPTIGENRRLSFYAAIFNEETTITEPVVGGRGWLTYREVVRPGAFTPTLATDKEVIANIGHRANETFARRSDGSLLLQQDAHGLFCSCYLPTGEFGDSILARIEAGELDACSFRFEEHSQPKAGDFAERTSLVIEDVCICSSKVAAYKGTEIMRTSAYRQRTLSRLRLIKIKNQQLNTNNPGGT